MKRFMDAVVASALPFPALRRIGRTEYACDASDLGLKPGQAPYMRLYDDAEDRGFATAEASVGGVHYRYWLLVLDSRANDSQVWHFEEVDEWGHRLGEAILVVFND